MKAEDLVALETAKLLNGPFKTPHRLRAKGVQLTSYTLTGKKIYLRKIS
jgi:hypothetical protein